MCELKKCCCTPPPWCHMQYTDYKTEHNILARNLSSCVLMWKITTRINIFYMPCRVSTMCQLWGIEICAFMVHEKQTESGKRFSLFFLSWQNNLLMWNNPLNGVVLCAFTWVLFSCLFCDDYFQSKKVFVKYLRLWSNVDNNLNQMWFIEFIFKFNFFFIFWFKWNFNKITIRIEIAADWVVSLGRFCWLHKVKVFFVFMLVFKVFMLKLFKMEGAKLN